MCFPANPFCGLSGGLAAEDYACADLSFFCFFFRKLQAYMFLITIKDDRASLLFFLSFFCSIKLTKDSICYTCLDLYPVGCCSSPLPCRTRFAIKSFTPRLSEPATLVHFLVSESGTNPTRETKTTNRWLLQSRLSPHLPPRLT